MELNLSFVDNGVIAKIETPASEGRLAETQTLLFVDQAKFLEWVELQWWIPLDSGEESVV